MISYWHRDVVCLSVHAVMLCIVALIVGVQD